MCTQVSVPREHAIKRAELSCVHPDLVCGFFSSRHLRQFPQRWNICPAHAQRGQKAEGTLRAVHLTVRGHTTAQNSAPPPGQGDVVLHCNYVMEAVTKLGLMACKVNYVNVSPGRSGLAVRSSGTEVTRSGQRTQLVLPCFHLL